MPRRKPPENPEQDPRPGPEGGPAPDRPRKAGPKRGPKKPSTDRVALARAMALVNAADDLPEPEEKVALAREAIEASRDCVEAYLLLADLTTRSKDALGHCNEALEACGRRFPADLLARNADDPWRNRDCRLVLRAMTAHAEALWAVGRRDEAVDGLLQLLEVDPEDNQGLRYTLVAWFLSLDQFDQIDRLIGSFDEDSTTWKFTQALSAFHREGNSPASRKALSAAKRRNKLVVPMLLGKATIPSPPIVLPPGPQSDAAYYVLNHLRAWKAVHGALTWVRANTTRPKRKSTANFQPAEPEPEGPSPSVLSRLTDWPIESDTWQVGVRKFSKRIELGDERVQPWMVLVTSVSHRRVLAHALLERVPSSAMLWDVVVKAIEAPMAGEAHRPDAVEVHPFDSSLPLKGAFESLEIRCSFAEKLEQVDLLLDDLDQHLMVNSSPSMLDMPGVDGPRLEGFYRAAADFYRAAPWRILTFESMILVECDRYESGPWYAVVMGQSGLTIGVALYENLDLLRKMWAGKMTEQEGARLTVALTATYDDRQNLFDDDLMAIEENDWPIAAPEAYPSFFRKERGMTTRPPLAWEIDLMVACMNAIPDFIRRRDVDDTTRELVIVPDAQGRPTELALSWVPEMS